MDNKFKTYLIVGGFIVIVALGAIFTSEKTSGNVEIAAQNIEVSELPKEICVYILGAVNEPGIVSVKEGTRLYEVIELVGRSFFKRRYTKDKFSKHRRR